MPEEATIRAIMHAVKEAVHETESCKHSDHGDVSIFLTRVETKLTRLLSSTKDMTMKC